MPARTVRMPVGGESIDELLALVASSIARPHEEAEIALTLAARLGTTSSALIDCRGYSGVLVATRVTAVAGVGTLQTRIASSGSAAFLTSFVTGTASTVSHTVIAYPGAIVGSSGVLGVCAMPLGRYLRIDGINSSAVGGNEVTFECSYILLR